MARKIHKNKKIFAPLVGAIVTATFGVTVVFSILSSISDPGIAAWAVIIVPAVFFVVLLHSIIAGIIFVGMYRYELDKTWHVLALGLFLSVAPSLVMILFRSNPQRLLNLDDILALSGMGGLGLLTAGIFKFVWEQLSQSIEPIKPPLIFWIGGDKPIFTTNLTLKEINKSYPLSSYYIDKDDLGIFSACVIKTEFLNPILLKRYDDSSYTSIYINGTQNTKIAQQYIIYLLGLNNEQIQWRLEENV